MEDLWRKARLGHMTENPQSGDIRNTDTDISVHLELEVLGQVDGEDLSF